MSDEPDGHILRSMRQADARLDGIVDDLADIKLRVTNLEENMAATNWRMDQTEPRRDLIDGLA
jgi:hypothetical protein